MTLFRVHHSSGTCLVYCKQVWEAAAHVEASVKGAKIAAIEPLTHHLCTRCQVVVPMDGTWGLDRVTGMPTICGSCLSAEIDARGAE